MNFNITSLVLIGIGLFVALRPLLQYFLKGRYSSLYWRLIQFYTKGEFEAAIKQKKADPAWTKVARQKIYEIGNTKNSYAKRKENLDYIKNALSDITITKTILNDLVDALRVQRDKEFQSELACYICDVATAIAQDKPNTPNNDFEKLPDVVSVANANAILLSSFIVGGFVWHQLDSYSYAEVLLISSLLFICLSAPLLTLIRGLKRRINVLFIVSIVTLAWLSLFSWTHHKGTDTKTLSLDTNTRLSVTYPLWLTYADIYSCDHINKVVSVLIKGDIPAISFESNRSFLKEKNADCIQTLPIIDSSTPNDSAFEFYYSPTSQTSLTYKEVKITPFLPDQTDQPIEDLSMVIGLENPVLGMAKVILLWGGSGGSVFVILAHILSNYQNQD